MNLPKRSFLRLVCGFGILLSLTSAVYTVLLDAQPTVAREDAFLPKNISIIRRAQQVIQQGELICRSLYSSFAERGTVLLERDIVSHPARAAIGALANDYTLELGMVTTTPSYFLSNASSTWTVYSKPAESQQFVTLHYDEVRRELVFLNKLPTLVYGKDGEKIGKASTVYVLPGVLPGSVIKIGSLIFRASSGVKDFVLPWSTIKNQTVSIYLLDRQNLWAQQNPSFESGLWQKDPIDCSAYLAGRPALSSTQTTTASNGKYALQLDSQNHFACAYKLFTMAPLSQGFLYRFSFDYQSLKGNHVKYNASVGTGKMVQNLTQDLYPMDSQWHEQEAFFSLVPNQVVTTTQVHLYAPSSGEKEIRVLYDNLALTRYRFLRETKPLVQLVSLVSSFDQRVTVPSLDEENSLVFPRASENLLSGQNPSFEEGLWSNKVEDCSNYLPGQPDIKMDLGADVDGRNALRLSSGNHFACATKAFVIKPSIDRSYELSFRYQVQKGAAAQYYVQFQKQGKQVDQLFEKITATTTNWTTYVKEFQLKDPDIDKVLVIFYAPSTGTDQSEVQYDDLQLVDAGPNLRFAMCLQGSQQIQQVQASALKETKLILGNTLTIDLSSANSSTFVPVIDQKQFDQRVRTFILSSSSVSVLDLYRATKSDVYYSVPTRANGNQNIWFIPKSQGQSVLTIWFVRENVLLRLVRSILLLIAFFVIWLLTFFPRRTNFFLDKMAVGANDKMNTLSKKIFNRLNDRLLLSQDRRLILETVILSKTWLGIKIAFAITILATTISLLALNDLAARIASALVFFVLCIALLIRFVEYLLNRK